MPDGSVVFLNSGSSIKYSNFNENSREVWLSGEAFFDVAKLANASPFFVHASGVTIKVLGTAFNIKSYADDNTVETVLFRGLIEVTGVNNTASKPLYLHPKQKLVIDIAPQKNEAVTTDTSAGKHIHIYQLPGSDSVDNTLETAWMFNRLQFRTQTFKELAPKLERWYNVKISFEDNDVKQLVFSGSFENETIDDAIAALKAASPFNYTIENNEIFIRSSTEAAP